ncbi:MAG: hypothetical protein H6733_16875 [Alphaproteobacteria bacterium]|nr:hypothetical protein [Alphaproteobacteria bacterium]
MAELRAVVRMPTGTAFDADVVGARLPTPTGQVGVRPGAEPFVTALDSGLVLLQTAEGTVFAGTAGGVARHDGATLTLFSPFAAVGDADAVLAALDHARSRQDGELAALRALSELESRITADVRAGRTARGAP